jgi:hypothetical protein
MRWMAITDNRIFSYASCNKENKVTVEFHVPHMKRNDVNIPKSVVHWKAYRLWPKFGKLHMN